MPLFMVDRELRAVDARRSRTGAWLDFTTRAVKSFALAQSRAARKM
jgi:hypothetical protein